MREAVIRCYKIRIILTGSFNMRTPKPVGQNITQPILWQIRQYERTHEFWTQFCNRDEIFKYVHGSRAYRASHSTKPNECLLRSKSKSPSCVGCKVSVYDLVVIVVVYVRLHQTIANNKTDSSGIRWTPLCGWEPQNKKTSTKIRAPRPIFSPTPVEFGSRFLSTFFRVRIPKNRGP